MTPLFKPYPHYQDTGTPWLGKIPAHWKSLPNRTLFQEVIDRNYPDEPLLVKFGQLADLRNSIRHSRTVDEITKKEGEAAILWFESMLR